jgi:transcriptional regulator with XRE-family HTH domain
MSTVGELIASRRRELGLSQRELAARLGEVSGSPTLTRHEVSRWERGGRRPAPYWRRWLAMVLSVDAASLQRPLPPPRDGSRCAAVHEHAAGRVRSLPTRLASRWRQLFGSAA